MGMKNWQPLIALDFSGATQSANIFVVLLGYTAVPIAAQMLTGPMVRRAGECGSCSGGQHREGAILRRYGAETHGPYRAGDDLPPGAVAVDTATGTVFCVPYPRSVTP